MKFPTLMFCLAICSLAALAAAGRAPGKAGDSGLRAPTLRPRARLGAAPKADFQVGNRKIHIEAGDPAIRAVRALPPETFEPQSRRRSVDEFYNKELAEHAPSKAELARWYVGPFRPEFVYWARHRWVVRDRALWAWHNRVYFDTLLWNEWMQEPEFAALIAQFETQSLRRKVGFIPDQYASNPVETIYNDQYIDAVYNPVYTTPSIVVDGSAGARLANLIQGVPRTFGTQDTVIESLAESANGLQFLAVPANFDPTYQIEVKRDGVLYIFGPRKTPLADGVGQDTPQWQPVSGFVSGPGVQAAYQRKVSAGEKIRLHGFEWSIASEQIDVLDSASSAARSAVSLVDAELSQMLKSNDGILVAQPELKDYLSIAQNAEQGLLTPLGNVDQDKIGLYYIALDKTRAASLAAAADQSSGAQMIASAKEVARQVTGLEESLNSVEELRNPDAPDLSVAAAPGTDSENQLVSRINDPSPAKSQTSEVIVPAERATQKYPISGRISVTPDPTSRWNTSPGRWQDCDFNGHNIHGQRAKNGMRYMQLCYRLNGGNLVAITAPTEIQGNGSIEFGPSDLEGGGELRNNTGSIRLTIAATPDARGESTASASDTPNLISANSSGTLCTMFKGGNVEVFVNGRSFGSPTAKEEAVYRTPLTLHHGDVLVFRLNSKFVNRNLRFAFVDSTGAVVFASTASSSVLREQSDPTSAVSAGRFDGDTAKIGNIDPGQENQWQSAGLPAAAECINVPQKNQLYEIAMTVP